MAQAIAQGVLWLKKQAYDRFITINRQIYKDEKNIIFDTELHRFSPACSEI
jgi:hypothetical protein